MVRVVVDEEYQRHLPGPERAEDLYDI